MLAESKVQSALKLSRRDFLTSLTGVAVALAAPGGAIASAALPVRDRELSFYNTHTGEQLAATFWSDGKYLDDGIEAISWLLRDHRAGVAGPMDPELLNLLYQLQTSVDQKGQFHVISGYRSPKTNEMLAKRSAAVAKRSYHMQGKAIDVRLPGFDTQQLRKAALNLKAGGVGYYSKSDFVHLDVGRVRYW
jgi:uncharacterized protein YcbK (DUF882 family)